MMAAFPLLSGLASPVIRLSTLGFRFKIPLAKEGIVRCRQLLSFLKQHSFQKQYICIKHFFVVMFNLILFGPPGSGKGTQSEKIIEKYGLKHLSTGDLLRSEIARETPLGLEAKNFMDKGALVPDEVVIGMISSALDENPGVNGFLFDGFPRTASQAEALDKLLELKHEEIALMLALDVSDEELLKRLLKRGETSGRSDDTNESIIKNRIVEYNNKTTPVADYYANNNKVVKVRGEGSIDEIFSRIANEIDVRQAKEEA